MFQALRLVLVSVVCIIGYADQLLSNEFQCNQTAQQQVRIGFLVGSKRAKDDPFYSRPGRRLLLPFEEAVAKVNQLSESKEASSKTVNCSSGVKFVSIVAETFGIEGESVKQTVELITKHKVNFIVGPQETCVIESRLAGIFNVGLISHFCSQLDESNFKPTTFIQTRAPNWKIVQRVVNVVTSLLQAFHQSSSTNKEAQIQLVLLYFEGANENSATIRSDTTELQYKLIGKLLETSLVDLLAKQASFSGHRLSVLNWHSTFHHGYTKNPFRPLIKRHLLHRPLAKQAADERCPRPLASAEGVDGRAVFIVVGHHYEHLGLMLALDELGAHRAPHSSVTPDRVRPIVVGVDIEPYNERDDSARYLRGLLINETPLGPAASQRGSQSPAAYGNYIGVVPASSTRITDLFAHIGQSGAGANEPGHQSSWLGAELSSVSANRSQASGNNATLQLTGRLFQFVRLPLEAFYLYDSIMLLGAYFTECLKQMSLVNCSQGERAFAWFVNRTYVSSLNDNSNKFDSQAQAEGFYTILMRRFDNESSSSSAKDDDDFGLVSVGHFDENNQIKLSVNWNELDDIWLPFWCDTNKNLLNLTQKCKLIFDMTNSTKQSDIFVEYDFVTFACIAFVLFVPVSLGIYVKLFKSKQLKQTLKLDRHSSGWFNENDEENFKHIVQNLLETPEINLEQDQGRQLEAVELHCHMFPFPSCKFVHWLTSLYQLKELMFQYQANLNYSNGNSRKFSLDACLKQLIISTDYKQNHQSQKSRSFFTSKHKSSAMLRLLLNKYKSVNESLCLLNKLNHPELVHLIGCTLSFTGANLITRSAIILLERPERGNLQHAIDFLTKSLSSIHSDWHVNKFKSLLMIQFIKDLLNGLDYLHKSPFGFHGELRPTTCFISFGWRLKLSGFHQHHMRRSLGNYEQKNIDLSNETFANELTYFAPEILANVSRRAGLSKQLMKLADVYSSGLIIFELLVGQPAWNCLSKASGSRVIVERVKEDANFRPELSFLDQVKVCNCFVSDVNGLKSILQHCWSHEPQKRPKTMEKLKFLFESCLHFDKHSSESADGANIAQFYTALLEKISSERAILLHDERKLCNTFRYNLLPKSIVTNLDLRDMICAQHKYESIAFCLFRFVLIQDESQQQSPVEQMNEILLQLDRLISNYHGHLHLVDSLVDSSLRQLAYSFDGPPGASHQPIYSHLQLIASFALQLIDLAHRWQGQFNNCVQVRCALHCGPALAGLLGGGNDNLKLARYVLFGSSLQLVDILESNSLAQRIQISSQFAAQLLRRPSRLAGSNATGDNLKTLHPDSMEIDTRQPYVMIKRESKIQAKGFGDVETFWLLNGPRLSSTQSLMLQ